MRQREAGRNGVTLLFVMIFTLFGGGISWATYSR